jgi:hypothetical protein
MPVLRPYRRTCRQFADGHYAEGGRSRYIKHLKFAKSPEHYVRGFLLLLKDLQELFDYVEPCDNNLQCYSYRMHALLLRACVEVEANFKAILTENGYHANRMSMKHYRKVNLTHRLWAYQVKVPLWTGSKTVRSPFSHWQRGNQIPWYEAYNKSKHDRHTAFELATFDNLIDASCGLLVLLSSQFRTEDFSPSDDVRVVGGINDGMEAGIGQYFRVRFPSDWPVEEWYDFDWARLKDENDPFQMLNYNKIIVT